MSKTKLRFNTKKYQIIKYISKNPNKTAREINIAVLNDSRPSHYSTVYSLLKNENIITSNNPGYKITLFGLTLLSETIIKDPFLEKAYKIQKETIIKSLTKKDLEIVELVKSREYSISVNCLINDHEVSLKSIEKLIKCSLISSLNCSKWIYSEEKQISELNDILKNYV
jgi:hypothetical protein